MDGKEYPPVTEVKRHSFKFSSKWKNCRWRLDRVYKDSLSLLLSVYFRCHATFSVTLSDKRCLVRYAVDLLPMILFLDLGDMFMNLPSLYLFVS